MRKLYYLLLLCVLLQISCSHVLDEPYDSRIALSTLSDYRALLSQAYPERQDLFTDILTDDYHHYAGSIQANLIPTYVPLYLWEDDYEEGVRATPAAAYAHYYEKIYLANTVIAEVMKTQGETVEKEALLGEALCVRAYAYFSLVNLFSKHYNVQTSGSDLGVPLILDVPTESKPSFHRATVAQVYEQIESDMKQGQQLMEKNATFLSANPYHFSLASVYAFFCRLYLYQEKWEQCISYADRSLQISGGQIRDLTADIQVWKSYDIAYFAQEFMNPATHKNILLASQSESFLTRPTGFRLCGFYPSHQLYYGFPKNDLRFGLFSAGGTVIDSITNYVKYAQQPNQPNVGVARYECFTNEEILLNRAEALLKQTVPDRIAAMETVEQLRKKRITPYSILEASTLSLEELEDLVLDQRRKEFLGQGMRWYDIKRLRLSVSHRLIRTSPTPDAVLTADDPRKAIQIPLTARIGNPVLVNELNPR